MTYPSDPTSTSLWHRFRPSAADTHTSLLFWLTVLAIGGVTLLTMTWAASSVLAKKGSEKLLRTDLFFPKLNSVHGDRQADPLRTSDLEHPKERHIPGAAPLPAVIDHPRNVTELPLVATAEPGVHLITQVEMIPAPTQCHDPLAYLHPCTSPPGDSPMIRNWKTLTMVSLLSTAAVTFVPQPAMLIAQEKKDPPVEVKGLDELQKSINELLTRIDKLEKKKAPALDQDALTEVIRAELKAALGKSMEALKADILGIQQDHIKHQLHIENQKAEIKRLTAELDGMRKKLAEGPAAPAVDKAFMEEVRTTLKTLNETIAKLGPTKERQMFSPPINGNAAQGRVVIVNLYNEDLLFLINGAPHRVPAGMSKLLDIPAGTLHYRVHSNRWGPLSNQTTTVAGGDTFTLTAAHQK